MVRTLALKSAVGALSCLVATAGLMAPAQAQDAVPIDQAGTLIGWGSTGTAPARTLAPAQQNTAFAAVAAGSDFTLALTAAGKVVVLGESATPGVDIQKIPASISGATATEIVAGPANAAAVTSDGKVAVWGAKSPDLQDPTDVPAGLTGVTSVALAGTSAAAVKSDGTVVTWGRDDGGATTVPPGLNDVKSVSGGSNNYYALTDDGTVVAWGDNSNDQLVLPASVTTAGNVKAVEARSNGALALLADGTLASWGGDTDPIFSGGEHIPPAGLTGKTVTAIAAQFQSNLALDSEGTLWVWGRSALLPEELLTPPGSLSGADIAQISIGGEHAIVLVTKVLEVTKPTVSGTAAPGQTLTATPATFSGGPTAVTGQWRADGADISGATSPTLALGPAQAGKRISFASKATKGSASATSVSDQTAVVAVDSTTSVSAAPSAYGNGGQATVTVSNGAGQPVSGTVTLSGAGGAQTAAVVGGKATFTLAKGLTPGAYALSASYSGGGAVKASSGSGSYSVAKGKTKRPAFKANKAPTSKKKGKATITVASNSGLAKATGKVTITLKGKSKKTIKTTLSGGKKSISLPKLKKGTYKVTVSYAGDKNYGAQKSSTFKLKIKK